MSALRSLPDGGADESTPLVVPDEASDAPRDTDGFEGYVGARAIAAGAHEIAGSATAAATPGDGARSRPSVLQLLWRSIWALNSLSAAPNDLESRDYDMYESDVMMAQLHERCLQVRAPLARARSGCIRAYVCAVRRLVRPCAFTRVSVRLIS
jgi:hypothetical protein